MRMDNLKHKVKELAANEFETYKHKVASGDLSTNIEQAVFATMANDAGAIRAAFKELQINTDVNLAVWSFILGLILVLLLVFVYKWYNDHHGFFEVLLGASHGHGGDPKRTLIIMCMYATLLIAFVGVFFIGVTVDSAVRLKNQRDDLGKLRFLLTNNFNEETIKMLKFEVEEFQSAYEAYAKDTNAADAGAQNKLVFHAKNIGALLRNYVDVGIQKKSQILKLSIVSALVAPLSLALLHGNIMWLVLNNDKGRGSKVVRFLEHVCKKPKLALVAAMLVIPLALSVYEIAKIIRLDNGLATQDVSDSFNKGQIATFRDDLGQLCILFDAIDPPPQQAPSVYFWSCEAILWWSLLSAIVIFVCWVLQRNKLSKSDLKGAFQFYSPIHVAILFYFITVCGLGISFTGGA